MTVQPAGDALKDELQEIGATMSAEWLESSGSEGKAIIDKFNAMK